jgi:hypothetical protein
MEMENKKEEKTMEIWDILKKILNIDKKNDIDDFDADPFYSRYYDGFSFTYYFNRIGFDDFEGDDDFGRDDDLWKHDDFYF